MSTSKASVTYKVPGTTHFKEYINFGQLFERNVGSVDTVLYPNVFPSRTKRTFYHRLVNKADI